MSDDMTCRLDDIKEEEPQVVELSPKKRFVRFNRKLGCGSYKTVYLGFDNDTGREVAWNVITFKHMSKQERKRIREEIDIVKSLNHNRIITFINTWINKQEEEVVFISERVTGGSLRSYINRLGAPLKIKVVRDWSRQILEGLSYLHTISPNPVIHRDLKCDNIFINGNVGEILIGDLGLSTILTESCAASVVGTPEFMAPEYYEEKYGTSVDIYAFGMCVLEMVVRKSPYAECSTLGQVYKKVIAGEKPLALARVKDQLLRDLIAVCLGTLAADRPTAEELLSDPFLISEDGGDRLCELWEEEVPRAEEDSQLEKPKHRNDAQKEDPVVNCEEQNCVLSGSGEIVLSETHEIDEGKNARNRNVLVKERQAPTRCSNRAAFDAIITKLRRQVVTSVHLLVHQPDDGTFHRVVFDYDTAQDSPYLVAKEMIEGGIVPTTIILQDLINRVEEAVTLRAHELLQEDASGGFEPLPGGGASSPSHFPGGMPHALSHDEVPVINISGSGQLQDSQPNDRQYMGPCEVQTVILQPGLQQVAVQTVLLPHDVSSVETSMVQMARHDPLPEKWGQPVQEYITATAVPSNLATYPSKDISYATTSTTPLISGTVVSDARTVDAWLPKDAGDGSVSTTRCEETVFEEGDEFTCPTMRKQHVCLHRGEWTQEISAHIVDLQRCLHFLVRVKIEDVLAGHFCPATETAVLCFQKSHALPSTGQVDEAFWEVLHLEVQQKQKAMQTKRDLAKEKAIREKEKKKEQQDRDSALQLANMMSDCFESLGGKNTSGISGELRRVASATFSPCPIVSPPPAAVPIPGEPGALATALATAPTATTAAITMPLATLPLIAPSSTVPMPVSTAAVSAASSTAPPIVAPSATAPMVCSATAHLATTQSPVASSKAPTVALSSMCPAVASSAVVAGPLPSSPPAPAASAVPLHMAGAPTSAPAVSSSAIPIVASPSIHMAPPALPGPSPTPAPAVAPSTAVVSAAVPSSTPLPASSSSPLPKVAPFTEVPAVAPALVPAAGSPPAIHTPAPSSPTAPAASAAQTLAVTAAHAPSATPVLWVSPTVAATSTTTPAHMIASTAPVPKVTPSMAPEVASSAVSATATHMISAASPVPMLDAPDAVLHGHAVRHAPDTPGHRSVLSRRESPSPDRSRPGSPEDPDVAKANRSAS